MSALSSVRLTGFANGEIPKQPARKGKTRAPEADSQRSKRLELSEEEVGVVWKGEMAAWIGFLEREKLGGPITTCRQSLKFFDPPSGWFYETLTQVRVLPNGMQVPSPFIKDWTLGGTDARPSSRTMASTHLEESFSGSFSNILFI